MNKIVKNSILVLLLSFAVGCSKDYEATDFASDVAWYNTELNKHPDAYRMNLGSVISFMDASQGCMSHAWNIEEGSCFMVDDFDIKNKDYVSQKDPGKGLSSSNTVESVIFEKSGITYVTLRDTFYEWVTAHDKNPVEAVLINGEWVLEKKFKIDVYEDLAPAFKVNYTVKSDNGLTTEDKSIEVKADDSVNINDSSTWQVIKLGLGEKIEFEDLTGRNASGVIPEDRGCRPTGANWDVPNSVQTSITCDYSDTSVDATNKAKFSFGSMKPANGDDYFSGFSITSQRSTPAQNIKKLIPIRIEIVASSDPFAKSTIAVDTDDSSIVKIAANGPFASVSADAKDKFSVTVTNSQDVAITPAITISSVEVDPKSNNYLNVVLSDKLYGGDKVKISYDGDEDDILSVDNRELEDFVETTIEAKGNSIIDFKINSFELERKGDFNTTGWNTLFATNAPIFVGQQWLQQLTRQGGAIGDNKFAFKFEIKDDTSITNSNYYITHAAEVTIPAGTYKARISVYVESVVDTNEWGGLLDLKMIVGQQKMASWDLNSATIGEWVTLSADYTIGNEKTSKLQISFGTVAKRASAGTCFWIDDFELVPTRPANN